MAVYALGDLHLSFYKEKPMDIFGDNWKNHTDKIHKNWIPTVKEGDTVVLTGDTSWAMNLDELFFDFVFLHGLPGRKIILKGNHDYWWGTHKKMRDFIKEKGFDSIFFLHNNAYDAEGISICGTRGWCFEGKGGDPLFDAKIIRREAERLNISLAAKNKGAKAAAFLHYPPFYEGAECPEIFDVLIKYDVTDCYYGHLHGHAHKKTVDEWRGVKLHLVACDAVDFMPYPVKPENKT